MGVRRAKAAFVSGCKSHPATIAPAGNSRRIYKGDELDEIFGKACHESVSLDFRSGSQPEVSDGHENVRFRGKSGSRFRATGGLLLAKSRSQRGAPESRVLRNLVITPDQYLQIVHG